MRPRDPAEARAKLRGIVDQAVARLEARREVHEQWEAVAAANQMARLSFDASPEGERLRRFQLAGNRSLLRTLETLLKLRRDGDGPQPDPAETADRSSPVEWPEARIPTRLDPRRAGLWASHRFSPALSRAGRPRNRSGIASRFRPQFPRFGAGLPRFGGSPDPAVSPTEGLPVAPEGLVGPRPAIRAIASGVRPSVKHSGGVRRPVPYGQRGQETRP